MTTTNDIPPGLDWPVWADPTPEAQRENTNKFDSTQRQTERRLKKEMELMDVTTFHLGKTHDNGAFPGVVALKLFKAAGLLELDVPMRASRDDIRTEQAERDEMVTPVTTFTNEAWLLTMECRQLRAARVVDRDLDLGAVRLLGDHVRAKVEADDE
jgi:hypothetical protein